MEAKCDKCKFNTIVTKISYVKFNGLFLPAQMRTNRSTRVGVDCFTLWPPTSRDVMRGPRHFGKGSGGRFLINFCLDKHSSLPASIIFVWKECERTARICNTTLCHHFWYYAPLRTVLSHVPACSIEHTHHASTTSQ